MTEARRRLGQSDVQVSAVGLGCWPLAGMTSGTMSEEAAVAVIDAALDAGIDHLDTAYAYGRQGESERRLARALRGRREPITLATKVGVYWDRDGTLTRTGRPELLREQVQESLRRLEVDHVDLLYLHAPAEDAPLPETAGLLCELQAEGKTRAVGVSNLSVAQMETFAGQCPFVACQMRYNWLQREIETDVLPWCLDHGVSVVAYEPLALGLLTGKLTRNLTLAEHDWRRQSPLFAGDAWTRNLDEVDRMRSIAERVGCSVAQLAVGWAATRPGVAAVLCGAKRPEQIQETAQTMAMLDALHQE